jgi:hypothetical protein
MIYARASHAVRSTALRILLALCGSLLMALSARISVPMVPVPITRQTSAIPLLFAIPNFMDICSASGDGLKCAIAAGLAPVWPKIAGAA